MSEEDWETYTGDIPSSERNEKTSTINTSAYLTCFIIGKKEN